jgi:oligopeptide transport system ATP-binding protein
MYPGSLVKIANRVDPYEEPLHPFTQALLTAVPISELVPEAKRKCRVLERDMPASENRPSGCSLCTCRWLAEKICEELAPNFAKFSATTLSLVIC